jgi:transposase
MSSIPLTADDRNTLLDYYRSDPDPQVRLRAHILLLLADGYPWATIAAVLFTSPDTIARWKGRFQRGGVGEVLGRPRGRKRSAAWAWVAVVVAWVLCRRPPAFGFARSRWSCEAVAVVLREDYRTPVSRETVRRWLRAAGLVWRRPRPVPGQADPRRAYKLRVIRELLRDLPDDEAAVFQDEVDLNLNPEIGCMWMDRGRQAEVATPGTNVKRYLACSWATWTTCGGPSAATGWAT